jgi:hypothetical protein
VADKFFELFVDKDYFKVTINGKPYSVDVRHDDRRPYRTINYGYLQRKIGEKTIKTSLKKFVKKSERKKYEEMSGDGFLEKTSSFYFDEYIKKRNENVSVKLK